MSHIVNQSLFINDLDSFEAAAGRCGMRLNRGQTRFAYYKGKRAGECLHSLSIAEPLAGNLPELEGYDYEIGVVARTDGQPGWDLTFDNFGTAGRRLTHLMGDKLCRLRQEYTVEVSMRQARLAGHQVRRAINQKTGLPQVLMTVRR